MVPSSTNEPAIVPIFGMVKVSRTSALPSAFSRLTGASRPAIAFFTSSSAS